MIISDFSEIMLLLFPVPAILYTVEVETHTLRLTINKSTKDKPYFLPQAGSNILASTYCSKLLSCGLCDYCVSNMPNGHCKKQKKMAPTVYSALCQKK